MCICILCDQISVMARRNHKHDLKEHNERRSCATRRFLKVFCLKEASHPHTFKKKKGLEQ